MFPYKFIFWGIFLTNICILGCSKEELVISPTVVTQDANSISQKSVKLLGEVTDDGFATINEKGFYLSKSNSNNFKKINLGLGKGKFEVSIDTLSPNTIYYYKSYAINIKGESFSKLSNFTTLDILPAKLTTNIPQNISYYSALFSATLNDDGGGAIFEKGFCISKNPNPTIKDIKLPVNQSGNELSLFVVKLEENTTYYIKAYSINEKGESYGNEQNFKTLKTQLAKVETVAAVEITQNSAKLSGSISDDGGLDIIEKGICYSMNINPTIKDSKISVGTGALIFSLNLLSLPINSRFFFRAYAINKVGISYGEALYFDLLKTKALTVITSPIFKKNSNDFDWNFGGELKDDGGFPIEDFGVVIGERPSPTITDNILKKSFYQSKINLPYKFNTEPNYWSMPNTNSFIVPEKTYYIRAYANNSKERIYGNEIVYKAEAKILEKEGGYIGYIFQKGDNGYVEGEEHGIIVSKTIFEKMKWGCTGINLIGAEKMGLGGGKQNTDDIIKDCPNITPASICKNLNLNGYSDWVLPNITELISIKEWRLYRIPSDFLFTKYFWTSSEHNLDEAHSAYVTEQFSDVTISKDNQLNFFAIRYY